MTLFNRQPIDTALGYATPDKRAQPRTSVHLTLTLVHNDIELPRCHVRNISNKGVYIVFPRDPGTSVSDPISLRFHIWTGSDHMTRVLNAEVLRYEQRGLAAAITDHDWIANEVVYAILYYQQRLHSKAPSVLSKRLPLIHSLNTWVAKLMS